MMPRYIAFLLLLGVVPLLAQAPPPSASVTDSAFEALVEVKQTPYNCHLTRDPFSAPTEAEEKAKADRVDDLGIKGWVRIGGKMMLVASDGAGNLRKLPVGHRFPDGEIVSINEKGVTFHCWEMNSTNRSAYRTVFKTFKREEGKR